MNQSASASKSVLLGSSVYWLVLLPTRANTLWRESTSADRNNIHKQSGPLCKTLKKSASRPIREFAAFRINVSFRAQVAMCRSSKMAGQCRQGDISGLGPEEDIRVLSLGTAKAAIGDENSEGLLRDHPRPSVRRAELETRVANGHLMRIEQMSASNFCMFKCDRVTLIFFVVSTVHDKVLPGRHRFPRQCPWSVFQEKCRN